MATKKNINNYENTMLHITKITQLKKKAESLYFTISHTILIFFSLNTLL